MTKGDIIQQHTQHMRLSGTVTKI